MNTRQPISLFGFLAGLVTGLAICVVVALYLTNAPVPFVSKVQPATESVTPDAIDPNHSLFSPQIPTVTDGGSGKAATTAEAGDGSARAPAPAAEAHVAVVPARPGASDTDTGAESGGLLMLQVGAYQNADDADAVRARLALLGLDAKVSSLQSEGATLYRVRLGPYGQLDDLNGIRRTLSENGMEPQVVHIH